MEQIVFPVPNICEFLTQESKLRVYYTTERDEQGSKINDFFLRSEELFNEMNWQKKLRGTQEAPGDTNTVPCASFSSTLYHLVPGLHTVLWHPSRSLTTPNITGAPSTHTLFGDMIGRQELEKKFTSVATQDLVQSHNTAMPVV